MTLQGRVPSRHDSEEDMQRGVGGILRVELRHMLKIAYSAIDIRISHETSSSVALLYAQTSKGSRNFRDLVHKGLSYN